jgi:hypothetical protein
MRAMSSEFDHIDATAGFVGVLDQFASLRSYTNEPAVGGYRVLSAKRTAQRAKKKIVPAATALGSMVRASRLQVSGSLSLLFIGSLGLAVLAGPANCPCGDDAERTSLARLGYVENAHLVSARDVAKQPTFLPELKTAAVVEPIKTEPAVAPTESAIGEAPGAIGESPITTSAVEPAHETVIAKSDGVRTLNAGALPPIEPLADAGPTVRVAAATPDVSNDASPALPVISARSPTTPKVVVSKHDDDADEAPRAKRKKKNMRAYRSPVAKADRHAQRPGGEQVVKRAPKWAQQMYATPWQMQAFSYTR